MNLPVPKFHARPILAAAALIALALSACATRPRATACHTDIGLQNEAIRKGLDRHFGKVPGPYGGYNVHVKVPRNRDARGNIILDLYDIWPNTTEDQPASTQTLTLVVDPCTHRVLKAYTPRP